MTIEEELAALLVGSGRSGTGPLVDRLGTIVAAFRAGEISRDTFITRFRGELSASYLGQYGSAIPQVKGVSRDDIRTVARLMDRQLPRIAAFADDIANDREPIPSATRLTLYADSARTAAAAGIVAGALAAGQQLRWVSEDDDNTCAPCAEVDGQVFTPQNLPGLPGWPYCDGGTRCRCRLETV